MRLASSWRSLTASDQAAASSSRGRRSSSSAGRRASHSRTARRPCAISDSCRLRSARSYSAVRPAASARRRIDQAVVGQPGDARVQGACSPSAGAVEALRRFARQRMHANPLAMFARHEDGCRAQLRARRSAARRTASWRAQSADAGSRRMETRVRNPRLPGSRLARSWPTKRSRSSPPFACSEREAAPLAATLLQRRERQLQAEWPASVSSCRRAAVSGSPSARRAAAHQLDGFVDPEAQWSARDGALAIGDRVVDAEAAVARAATIPAGWAGVAQAG